MDSKKDSAGSTDGSHDAAMSAGSTVVATPGPGHNPAGGHNSSAQQDVYANPDPALDISNEHHHPHVHHGSTAVPDEKDDIVYAKSSDKYTGDGDPAAPDYKVRQMGSNEDEESGRVGRIDDDYDGPPAKNWDFSRFMRWAYKKYKPLFHGVFWAVWTA